MIVMSPIFILKSPRRPAPCFITFATLTKQEIMEIISTLTHRMTIFSIFRACRWIQSSCSFGTSEKCGGSAWSPKSSQSCPSTSQKRSCRPPLSRWEPAVTRILFVLGLRSRPKQIASSCGTCKTISSRTLSMFSLQRYSSRTVTEILTWQKKIILSTALKDANSNATT